MAGFAEFKQVRFFRSLDGIRALAILAVIWHHMGPPGGSAFAWGKHGVTLFFALSGFLITTLIVRERDATGDVNLGNFYMRRTLRIFPPYYLVIAAYCVLEAFVEKEPSVAAGFWGNLPYFLTYTTNVFVQPSTTERVVFYFSWSLATEEQFYLLWPLVVRVFGARASLLMAGVVLARELFLGLVSTGLLLAIVRTISPAICFGSMLAIALNSERGYQRFASVFGRPFAPALLLAMLAAYLVFASNVDSYGGYPVAILATLLVGACVVKEQHVLAPLLSWAPLAKIGAISYGMYLLHMICLNVVRKIDPNIAVPLKFLATVAITVVAAIAMHELYEKPFLRLKERFTAGAKAKAKASAVA